jgi:hypothetical protein
LRTFSSVGIIKFAKGTEAFEVTFTLATKAFVGEADGEADGNTLSHRPHARGQFFTAAGYVVHRSCVSFLATQAHFFFLPSSISKLLLLLEQWHLLQRRGQFATTSAISHLNQVFCETHLQFLLFVIHTMDSIENRLSESSHQLKIPVGDAVIVGGLVNVGVDVGLGVGLFVGLVVGGIHSPHVTGHLSFTFGKVHLYCVFLRATQAQLLFSFSPEARNLILKRPLESAHSSILTLRVILGREIEATILWESLIVLIGLQNKITM